jgi:hypothetical protein
VIVYIITEESFRNEARIVAVFSSEEAAEEFLFENEGDGETTLCVEEWSVDEELL